MIVLDSSTIILLAKAEILDTLLNSYKGDVIIPEAVERESAAGRTFDALLIKKRLEEGRIKVKAVNDEKVDRIMGDFGLNTGEAEAIILALESKGSVLGTDDRNAINACKILHIPFTTAIGVLIRSREKNLVTKKEAIERLSKLAAYGWYKKEIIEDAKRRLEYAENAERKDR
ncbi:MAG: hypothetical protein HYX24_05930 [Candidatus Aenigmarchaeota archaeon]|nr:hypothetical protein [Candidatus Aenigmarchaeota archaeon]